MGVCPSQATLEGFALESAGGGGVGGVAEHVAGCNSCAAAVAEIIENHRFLIGARAALRKDAEFATRTIGGPVSDVQRRAQGSRFDDEALGYELQEEIGRGGQGVVFRAVQTATKRPAAVKMLLSGLFASERQRRRFEREVEIAARLRHPNLVTVFESGVTVRGNPYVAMEYVEGVPIDQFVESRFGAAAHGAGQRARADGVMRLMAMTTAGVAHAHVAGIIHRDLKPSNILVDVAGHPRVLDFGLAREAEAGRGAPATREFVGTPAYAAPEQFVGDGASVNARADVYSLGLLMYALLTGRHPYPAEGALAEVARHAIETEPASPSRYVRRLPSDVETIVLKCLAKEPLRRYASAVPLATDIDDYLNGRPISARRDSTAYVLHKLAMRHKIPAIAVGLLLLTVLGATVGLALLARDLERALDESIVQRARLMAATGDVEVAESLLWKHAVRTGAVGEALMGPAAAEARRSAWSLAELYSRVPRRFRAEFPGIFECGIDPQTGDVWAFDMSGSRQRWSPEGQLVESRRANPLGEGASLSCASENGRFAVYQSSTTLVVYDYQEQSAVRVDTPWSPNELVRSVSPDGDVFAAISKTPVSSLRLFDTRSGRLLLEASVDPFTCQFTRKSGEVLLLVGTLKVPRPRVEIRRGPAWTVFSEVPVPVDVTSVNLVGVSSPRMTDDGRYIAACTMEQSWIVDRSESGGWAARSVSPGAAVLSQAFLDGEASLALAAQSARISIYSVPALRHIETIVCPSRPASLRALGAGAGMIAYADIAGSLSVYDSPKRSSGTVLSASNMTHQSVAIASDGTLAWGDDAGDIVIRPPGGVGDTVITCAHDRPITSVHFAPDGSRLVSAGHDGIVKVWSVSGALERTMTLGNEVICSARFSPDGRTVAAADNAGNIFIWWCDDLSGPMTFQRTNRRNPEISFSPDGRLLACAAIDASSFVLDLTTWKSTTYGAIGRCRSVAWSPDGRTLAFANDDRAVRIWDQASGRLIYSIEGLPGRVYNLAFHPTGRLLFVAGEWPEIVVLDPEAGRELAKLKLHERPIFSIQVSPDGRFLVTGGQDPWIGVTDLNRLREYVDWNEPYWARRLVMEGAPDRAVGAASPATTRTTNRR